MCTRILYCLFLLTAFPGLSYSQDYANYHSRIHQAEQHLIENDITTAVREFTGIFSDYSFVFLRDYQVAAQAAALQGYDSLAFAWMRAGIRQGWSRKSLGRHAVFDRYRKTDAWKRTMKYAAGWSGRVSYDPHLVKTVKRMFRKDQWKALGALFTFSSDAQDRYAEKRFAPHSEIQMRHLASILQHYGYPGEKLVGNEMWMSTILSHHNSISQRYNARDTLFINMRPALLRALNRGEIAPGSLGLIEDWYHRVTDKSAGYGILTDIPADSLERVNVRRAKLSMRPVSLWNALITCSRQTGIDMHLSGQPWRKGKILLLD